jgi:hypothetical protein
MSANVFPSLEHSRGVQVGVVAIGARIARFYWELHRKHEQVEKVFLLDVAEWLLEARVR